jgi:hypothetical protein
MGAVEILLGILVIQMFWVIHDMGAIHTVLRNTQNQMKGKGEL